MLFYKYMMGRIPSQNNKTFMDLRLLNSINKSIFSFVYATLNLDFLKNCKMNTTSEELEPVVTVANLFGM